LERKIFFGEQLKRDTMGGDFVDRFGVAMAWVAILHHAHWPSLLEIFALAYLGLGRSVLRYTSWESIWRGAFFRVGRIKFKVKSMLATILHSPSVTAAASDQRVWKGLCAARSQRVRKISRAFAPPGIIPIRRSCSRFDAADPGGTSVQEMDRAAFPGGRFADRVEDRLGGRKQGCRNLCPPWWREAQGHGTWWELPIGAVRVEPGICAAFAAMFASESRRPYGRSPRGGGGGIATCNSSRDWIA